MGGMTAMQLAVTAPERLTGIAVCNSSADIAPQPWLDRVAAVRAGGVAAMADAILTRWFPPAVMAANPPYLATAKATLESVDTHGYAACCMAIAGLAVKDRLAGIATPTLVVAGSMDVATPPATGAEPIAAAIPGAKLVSLPTGHISPLERPDALAALLANFFLPDQAGTIEAGRDALFDAGIANRRAVLGDAWVDKALAKQGGFAWEFQQFITRFAWSEVWGRPGLDHRTRRIIVLAITIALGRWEEFRLHTRSALEQKGLTEEEVREVLIQSAIYAGVPAANTAFHMTEEIIAAMSRSDSAGSAG